MLPLDYFSPQLLLSQINSVHCNPVDSNIFVTASNDWTMRLFDMRVLPSSDTDALPKSASLLSLLCTLPAFEQRERQGLAIGRTLLGLAIAVHSLLHTVCRVLPCC